MKTHKQDIQGRFEVSLPLKDNVTELDLEQIAQKRFLSLEKKLQSTVQIKQNYQNCMCKYEILGHMTQVNENVNDSQMIYYLPRRNKGRCTTTKLKVVFDASSRTDTGLLLNDTLKVGPTIQRDLFSIIISFRRHNIVFTADIEKIYRQVNVTSTERDFQQILWRAKPHDKLKHYKLNTVTYGTASAALAIRSLYQTAIDNEKRYPETRNVIK